MRKSLKSRTGHLVGIAAGLAVLAAIGGVCRTAQAQTVDADQATRLSEFGERPEFSPDGKRLVFVGKALGDAFEIDLTTHKVRNVTQNVPHQGVLRIQYLSNGDFLVTAPRFNTGVNSRAHAEMWVLSKDGQTVLQPLGEKPLEGIAVDDDKNLIAWAAFAPGVEIGPKDGWMTEFSKPTKHYVAEIRYTNGVPKIVNKREIMQDPPKDCIFAEPQDFRDNDKELVFTCSGQPVDGKPVISVMGYNMETKQYIIYRRVPGEYNEVEGVAPGGNWAAIECGKQDVAVLPPIDLCRLELKPNGEYHKMIIGTKPGSSADISNPVISPDGKRISFQRSDRQIGEAGEGLGVYIMDVPK